MKALLYNYSINSYTYGVIMSRNEWEAGKVVIPSHSWSKLKKALQKAHNEQREQILKEAEKHFSSVTNEKKSYLLAEKAFQLLQHHKMTDVDKTALQTTISAEMIRGDFNFYVFVKELINK